MRKDKEKAVQLRRSGLSYKKIREELVSQEMKTLGEEVSFESSNIQNQFKKSILILLRKYFPTANQKTMDMLINYILQQNIGIGNIDVLLKDPNLWLYPAWL